MKIAMQTLKWGESNYTKLVARCTNLVGITITNSNLQFCTWILATFTLRSVFEAVVCNCVSFKSSRQRDKIKAQPTITAGLVCIFDILI